MNAYELADWIENSVFQIQDDGTTVGVSEEAVYKSATMLRQQADRIVDLEKCAAYYRDKYYFQDKSGNSISAEEYQKTHELYTHPVKQLSDEEIYKIYLSVEKMKCPSDDFEYMTFARAIIKEITE